MHRRCLAGGVRAARASLLLCEAEGEPPRLLADNDPPAATQAAGGGGSDSGGGGRGDGGSGGGGLVGRIDLPTLLEALSARGLDPAVRTRGGDEAPDSAERAEARCDERLFTLTSSGQAPVLVELDGGTLELRGAQSVVRSADFDLIVLVQEAIREQLVEL